MRPLSWTALALMLTLAGCDAEVGGGWPDDYGTDGGSPADDDDEDDPDLGQDIDAGADDIGNGPDYDAGPTRPLGRNDDVKSVVVWSQNIHMGLDNWQNIVRCMGDRACNSLGAVPDIILLQEASCKNIKAMRSLLWKPRSQGGLGISGWKHYCADNPNSGGVTGHWMSNGIIYRADRFRINKSSDARRIEFLSGDGTFCRWQGKVWPVVALLDVARKKAGYAEKRVTLAVRHDDHFGKGGKNTCQSNDATTKFCVWQNSRLIDAAMRDIGGGLFIIGGDWNYAARYCTHNGTATHNFKYAYACSTKGVRSRCSPGNLGWRDPLLENDPTVYDKRKSIDFLHGRDMRKAILNETRRHHRPGEIGTHFYCAGHGPYTAGSATKHPERMTDHSGRLIRFRY